MDLFIGALTNSDKPNKNLKLYNKTLDTSGIQGFFVFKRYLYTNDFYMQYFYITQNSTLPTLRMELIEDGRHDYNKVFEALQAADITFTMTNIDTNVVKVAKNKAYIKLRENDDCTEQYVICYDWKERDTKEAGSYKGVFEITFNGNLKNDSYTYPSGILNMPIREELIVVVLPK